MTERWPKVLSTILAVALILVVAVYVYQGFEYKNLRSVHEENLQTLQRQTHLIVDLRLELAGLHHRNFESEQALQDWTNHWMLTRMPLAIEFLNTSIELRGEKYSMYQDCDDFAEAMQRDALRDGYLMSIALVDETGTVCGVKVTDLANHAGIIAVTDNTYWFVEPRTGQLVRIIGRD